MDRIWLKKYPAGVPADIDVNQYNSLSDLMDESFKKFADRRAFICMDKAISYKELDEMSTALGAYLQSLGLLKGARVAIMLPTITCLTAVLAITCCTVVAKFSRTMIASAPESFSWCSSSRGV